MTIDAFLTSYGGALILPLSIIEGPVVTVIAGVLCRRGFIAWYWAFGLLTCGDVIGDGLYYCAGRYGGTRLARVAHWLGMPSGVPEALKLRLRQNAARVLMIGKWTHAIGGVVLVGCGMLRLPLPEFLLVNLLASLPKTACLFAFGYFADQYHEMFERHAIAGSVLLLLLGAAAMWVVLRRRGGIRAGDTRA